MPAVTTSGLLAASETEPQTAASLLLRAVHAVSQAQAQSPGAGPTVTLRAWRDRKPLASRT